MNPAPARKLVPVIDRDYCTGCNACVEACARKCIELKWDFATLARPGDCVSDGACIEACPEGLLAMDWISVVGDVKTGRWRRVG